MSLPIMQPESGTLTQQKKISPTTLLLAGIFACSGALALVYQVTWCRMLGVVFGTDAAAVATVVALFMGGLALGAHMAGRHGNHLRHPLLIYGLLESALGLYVLFSPVLLDRTFALLLISTAHTAETLWLLNVKRVILSGLVLLPPTILMGATLPILARFAEQLTANLRRAAHHVSLLYAINIGGAVVGCLLAGFVMLPRWGQLQTITFSAWTNLILGLLVVLFAWRHQIGRPRSSASSNSPPPPPPPCPGLKSPPKIKVMLIAVMLTGAAGMICQIAWTRVLVLITGASAYTFSTVLAAVLLGLGGGAGLATIGLHYLRGDARALFTPLALMSALVILAGTFAFGGMPELFVNLFNEQAASSTQILRLNLLLAGLSLLPATMVMGMLFPLALRLTADGGIRSALGTGGVYTWNTVGAIIGCLGAGFGLIPWLGIRHTIMLAAVLLVVAGLLLSNHVIARATRRTRSGFYHSLTTVLLLNATIVALFLAPQWDKQLLAAGVSEYTSFYRKHQAGSLLETLHRQEELLYYRDGLTATITVTRDLQSKNRDLYISTNGKIDGSSHSDMPTQKLSAHLPLLLHPNPAQVCVIGLGTGITAGSATLHPEVEKVVVAEIEPAMVVGARFFASHNQNLHNQPMVTIRLIDGRFHLMLHPSRYDVIISEPSNPWIAGVANLFTLEFYQQGAKALRPGGIFAQWLQIYNLKPANVLAVINTFRQHFPYTVVAVTIVDTDLLLIGSQTPFFPDLKNIDTRMQESAVAADLSDHQVGINNIFDLLARIWLAPAETALLAAGAAIHTDDRPFLMYEAPLSRGLGTRSENTERLLTQARGVEPWLIQEPHQTSPEFRERMTQTYQEIIPKRYLDRSIK